MQTRTNLGRFYGAVTVEVARAVAALTIVALVVTPPVVASPEMPATAMPDTSMTPAIEDGDPPVLTLERAIDFALADNRDLRVSDAQLEAAVADLDEARSRSLPQISFDASFQRTDHPVLVFSNLLSQSAFGAENFALENLNDPDPLSSWKTRVAITQPLWSGGRIRLASEMAELERDAVALGREASRQQVVHRVIERYSGAVLAVGELRVTRESLASARAHVALVRDLRNSGLVVESDLLQAEVRESEVREILIRAESAVEISRAALNQVMGRDLDTPFVLPEAGDFPAVDLPTAEADLVQRALLGRPDLQAVGKRRAASQRQVRIEEVSRLPSVGLAGSYESNSEELFSDGGESWAVTVGVQIDLFDAGRRARARRAAAREREAEEGAEVLEQAIALEVRRAYHSLRAAREHLEQTAKGIDLAQRSRVIIEDRYREGLTILPELLDAETTLLRARLRQVSAHRDLLLARASLDLAIGNL